MGPQLKELTMILNIYCINKFQGFLKKHHLIHELFFCSNLKFLWQQFNFDAPIFSYFYFHPCDDLLKKSLNVFHGYLICLLTCFVKFSCNILIHFRHHMFKTKVYI
jgi:hypothetical protein